MRRVVLITLSAVLMAVPTLGAQEYTRGLGVYPGDPKEDFSPLMAVDRAGYRNLALHRPAYHSSSYDYNLTAQLVTDGIKETKLPRWLVTGTSQNGVLPKREREFLLDGNIASTVNLKGSNVWVQFELAGGDAPFVIERVDVKARTQSGPAAVPPAGWTCILSGSDDGQSWAESGALPARCRVRKRAALSTGRRLRLLFPRWRSPSRLEAAFTGSRSKVR